MQLRSTETRTRILSSAEKLFALSGYDAAGVADICEEAGVSKGAFYHHFPSKHAVFMQLLDVWLSGLDTQIEKIRQSNQYVPQALFEMAALTQNIFQAADKRLPIFLEFWTQASRDPEVWRATIAPYRRYQQLFREIVQEGIDQGSLRRVDPDATARMIIALVLGLLLQGLLDPEGAAWEKLAQESMQILVEGLRRR